VRWESSKGGGAHGLRFAVLRSDDVLHIRNLPTFGNRISPRNCELLLQYLTVPYLRIPLVLQFFARQEHITALACEELQEVWLKRFDALHLRNAVAAKAEAADPMVGRLSARGGKVICLIVAECLLLCRSWTRASLNLGSGRYKLGGHIDPLLDLMALCAWTGRVLQAGPHRGTAANASSSDNSLWALIQRAGQVSS
jgi:hypothetical protein